MNVHLQKLKYNLTSDLHTGRTNSMKCLQNKTNNILKYLEHVCHIETLSKPPNNNTVFKHLF